MELEPQRHIPAWDTGSRTAAVRRGASERWAASGSRDAAASRGKEGSSPGSPGGQAAAACAGDAAGWDRAAEAVGDTQAAAWEVARVAVADTEASMGLRVSVPSDPASRLQFGCHETQLTLGIACPARMRS